jgi:hypothetical protein
LSNIANMQNKERPYKAVSLVFSHLLFSIHLLPYIPTRTHFILYSRTNTYNDGDAH